MEKAAHYWSIGKVALYLGVSVVTLRRWDKEGRLSSDNRTFGKHRRYDAFRIQRLFQKEKPKATVGYARVSSYDQKDDLERQANTLKQHYPNATIIKDLGNLLSEQCNKSLPSIFHFVREFLLASLRLKFVLSMLFYKLGNIVNHIS